MERDPDVTRWPWQLKVIYVICLVLFILVFGSIVTGFPKTAGATLGWLSSLCARHGAGAVRHVWSEW